MIVFECPYCGEELVCVDYFGRVAKHQDGKILGDIYKCFNEECDRYEEHFYSYRDRSELHEGYPC